MAAAKLWNKLAADIAVAQSRTDCSLSPAQPVLFYN